jgi:alpha-L-fucosidase
VTITRRDAIKLLAGAVPAVKAASTFAWPKSEAQIQPGPFKPTRESLKAYRIPDWYRDAKFGIWAHWGPQSAAEYGDWYARGMYLEGEWQYKHHVETYGHPSKFGFKDVIETWKADKFDPDYLVGLYKRAGAKYFVSMGVHHDNFCLWNSKHTRWNSVRMGPRKDIVGLFRKAALNHGLRFGVTEHLWITYKWFSVSHGADKFGPYAGVPYDGADPRYVDLYLDCPKIYKDLPWDEEGIPESWKRTWFLRVKDLIDQHQPDFLYSDGSLPFQQWGLDLVTHYYNQNARQHQGKVEGVYTSKHPDDCAVGTCVLDVERGVVQDIWPNPWQTDTCIGNWHYQKGATYKSPKIIIDLLVDIVSRNGNLLLNFPLPNNGMLDSEELKILDEITRWMGTNGSAIYATRPWKIYGTGPGTHATSADAKFNENKRKELTSEDIRFTTKGQTLYAFLMGWPEKPPVIEPLATRGKYFAGHVRNVELLGREGKLDWTQDASGLRVQLPHEKPGSHAFALKIEGLDLQALP